MKILLISSYLPYPLHDGGRIRLYNLLKFLKEKHEITLICEKRESQTDKDVGEVSKICHKVIAFPRPKAFTVSNIFRTIFSRDSFLTTVHKHNELKKLIENELKLEKYDLIHVETFYVMQNLPKTTLPVVLVEHNIEYKVYERFAAKSFFVMRPFLAYDAYKMKRQEKIFWKKADALVAVSPAEQDQMGQGTLLIPNGVDTKRFSLKKLDTNKKEKIVLFIGNFKWIANRDSIIYIIKNIWPRISTNEHTILRVVGKNIPDSIKKLGNDRIIFDENATNKTEEIFQDADLLLNPVRVGGGTNFKTLESMSTGTPVITTNLGNEGLGAKNKSEILIAERPDEFSRVSLEILSDKYTYEKISRNARNFVVKNYDWESISKKLDAIYQSLK